LYAARAAEERKKEAQLEKMRKQIGKVEEPSLDD